MKKNLQILFLLIFSIQVFAQNKIEDLKRADAFLQKAIKLETDNKDEALKNINKGLFIAKRYSDTELIANLYKKEANIFDNFSEYDSSYVYYKLAAPIFVNINDSVNAAKCFINIGVSDYYYGNFDKAVSSYQNASNLLENSKEYSLRAKAINNIGLIHKSQGNYKQAIKDFHESIDLKTLANDKKGIANTYQNIGVIYWEQKNYNEALKCFNDAENVLIGLGSFDDLAGLYTNKGLIYNDIKDTTQALLYYDKAIEGYSKLENKQGLVSVFINKASLLDNAGRYDDAKKLFKRSLKLSEEIGYSLGVFVSKINLSRMYSSNNKKQKAINLAQEALRLKDKKQPVKYLIEAYHILSKNYEDIRNYKLANKYLNKYIDLNDSVFNIEKNKQINEIHTKYETEKKENEITLLKKDAKIHSLEMEKKDKRIRSISITLIVIFIPSIISLVLYFQKRASYLLLVEQNVKLTKTDIEKEVTTKVEKNETVKVIEKYSEIKLNKIQKKELIDDIIVLMEEEKYYLNKQFTINDFAKELQSNRNYLSQIINEYFNTNFNNFVNEFRVKEARKLLLSHEYENYTIEGIANSVGFHSKATFNTAFKKFTGVTPSFFKNKTKHL